MGADEASWLPPVAIIATVVGVIAVATSGLFILDGIGGDDSAPNSPADTGLSIARHDANLSLPLALADAGFADGTIDETAANDGPGAASYCGGQPAIGGLTAWRANRLTESGGQRRITQMVARFDSTDDAASYLQANIDLLSCASWTSTAGPAAREFTARPGPSPAGLGDEALRFDVELMGAEPLFLRTFLTRTGPTVLQVTSISADPADLDRLHDVTSRALSRLEP